MTFGEMNIKLKTLNKILDIETNIVAKAIAMCFGGEEKKEKESNEQAMDYIRKTHLKPPSKY